ncbi:lipopolysaccharide biosynthesis protein [Streptomyces sp. VRA16 Mangrove soil]|uniref:lipopolysaccharide biosynthesis protein n=1 Tax=Streptomyces sp. VRA16 Mangrove soil TaxID=2817434 RepID=UPI001A9F17A3|nr:lipopolysaccharide biosynthesis protein [Streptomyces sp. VRA16 Mangrove soil]MBO1337401.1 lipopolysaccharide biosynthesis protein [Streptomyces sp. VRA16 Mangrove soil]
MPDSAQDKSASRTPFARRTGRLPRWWPLPLGLVAGALAGGTYGAVSPPQYTATSYVIAVPTDQADSMSALGFAQAYSRVATQVAVLSDAQVAAGVPVETLKSQVRAETSPDAPMVAISAVSDRPAQAMEMANAVARALTTNAGHTKDDTHVKLLRFTRAVKPTEPSSASAALTTLVGACAGGLLGGLALLLRPRRTADAAVPTVPAPATAAAGLRGGA